VVPNAPIPGVSLKSCAASWLLPSLTPLEWGKSDVGMADATGSCDRGEGTDARTSVDGQTNDWRSLGESKGTGINSMNGLDG